MPPAASSNSVKIISLNRNKLLQHLQQITRRIQNDHPNVAEIRLFGSLGRGNQTGMSDVDILIILEHTVEKDPLQRILTFLPYFEIDRGVDILVFSRSEIEHRLTGGDGNFNRILAESILL